MTSLRLRIALGVGILALMTMKPSDHATAILVLGTAVLATLAASIPLATRPLNTGNIRNERTIEAPGRT